MCAASMSTFDVSLTFAGASNPLVILRSLAMTIPSLAKIPTQVPALLMASIAYSTYVINQTNNSKEIVRRFSAFELPPLLNTLSIIKPIPGGVVPPGKRSLLKNRNVLPLYKKKLGTA